MASAPNIFIDMASTNLTINRKSHQNARSFMLIKLILEMSEVRKAMIDWLRARLVVNERQQPSAMITVLFNSGT